MGRAEIATAYFMAIGAINEDALLLPLFDAFANDTTQDSKQTMFRVLLTQILDVKVSAIIGPSFSSQLIDAVSAAVYNTPLISFSATR